MQLEQSFKLNQPSPLAWEVFKNVELLVTCLPGATLTGPALDGELPLRFEVKLGPIAAAFVGSGRVTFDDTAQSGKFEGQATDKRSNSRVKGAAVFALKPEGLITRVDVSVDYALTGTLAQFSRGAIVRDLALALTAQFATNLAEKMGSSAGPFVGTPPVPGSAKSAGVTKSTPRTAGQSYSAPLDGWTLIKQVFTARFKRFLGVLGLWKNT